MSKQPIHVDDELEMAMLQRARAGIGPSPTQRRQTLERLATKLAAAPLPRNAAIEPRLNGPRFALRTLVMAVVAGSLVGFAVGASNAWKASAPAHASTAPTRLPTAIGAPASSVAASTPAANHAAEPNVAMKRPLSTASPGHGRPTTEHEATPSAAATRAKPTLYDELSAVRRAQSALKRGEATLALGLMNQLDESHPGGALRAERNVTKVLALCRLDRRAEATTIVNRILRDDRDAEVYRRRLVTSCAGPAVSSTGK